MINEFVAADCSFFAPPAIDVECFNTPKASQVCTLILIPLGAAKPSAFTFAGLEAVIDNSATTNQYGRRFDGVGGVEQGTAITLPAGRIQRQVGIRKTLSFTIPITEDWQYNMILQLQKGKLAFDFWFATLSGRTVGGLQGIRPISVFADFIYLEDVRECEKAIIELTWIGSGAADQAIIAEYGLPNVDAVAPGPPAGNLISDDTGTVITDDTGLGILGF